MHSSGIRTARLLTVSQYALWPGVVPAWGVYLPGGVCICPGGGGTCPGTATVDRQAPVKNITFANSFAGGNYTKMDQILEFYKCRGVYL